MKLNFRISRFNKGGYLSYLPKADRGTKFIGTDYQGNDVLNPDWEPRIDWDKIKEYGKAEGGSAAMAAGTAFSKSVNRPINQDYFNNSSYFRSQIGKAQDMDKTADAVSAAAQVIPGWGQLAAGVIQGGKGIGKATHDENGIYKSKFAEYADNQINITKSWKNIGDALENPSWSNLLNIGTSGIFGKNAANEEAKREKQKWEMRGLSEASTAGNEFGSMSRAGIGGYEAAPYGKKGMKLKSKYSVAC